MSKRRLLILGNRTLASAIADQAADDPTVEITAFVENMDRQRCTEQLDGLPILWIDDIAEMARTHSAVCALATTFRSRFVEQAHVLGMPFATLVHPTACISSRSTLGQGTIVSPGVVISVHTKIGQHVIINRGVLIGHHTTVDDYATIQPGANIAGLCSIGHSTYVGMGAIILDHLKIGAHSIVAAGAVVTSDVPDHVQVMGVPARIVKENVDGK
ncbi:MAG: acetyltransferase [Planctomycetaceae bacterium]|nr:acetyltransferase [Planctomycetaceae bacterium]